MKLTKVPDRDEKVELTASEWCARIIGSIPKDLQDEAMDRAEPYLLGLVNGIAIAGKKKASAS